MRRQQFSRWAQRGAIAVALLGCAPTTRTDDGGYDGRANVIVDAEAVEDAGVGLATGGATVPGVFGTGGTGGAVVTGTGGLFSGL